MTVASPALALARGVQLAASLSMFGILNFAIWIPPFPPSESGVYERRIRGAARISIACALFGCALWLPFQTAEMAGTGTIGDTIAALPVIALESRFGHALLLRVLLLISVAGLVEFGRSQRAGAIGALLAGLACALQVATSHAATADVPALTLVAAFHILAAGAWLGGLWPLWLLVGARPDCAGVAARRFSLMGVTCVVTLVASATIQGVVLVGGMAGLFGTAYGQTVLAKSGLFALLLGLAGANRFVLTPALDGLSPRRACRWLRLSITAEATIGLLVVLLAATLGTLPPGVHEDPVWPFSLRPSLEAIAFPFQRREMMEFLAAVAGIVVAAGVTIARPRLFWVTAPIALVLYLAAPPSHLGLLFVPAFPTSYAGSPTGFTAASVAEGAALFATHCATCHGADGRGDGPAATPRTYPPPDLTSPGTAARPDGDLLWFIMHGISDSSGPAMPAFGDRLSEADGWKLVDFIRADAAGTEIADTGTWETPARAPAVTTDCSDGRFLDMRRPDGTPTLVIAATKDGGVALPPAGEAFETILLTRTGTAHGLQSCVDASPETWRAYALVGGISPDKLDGTWFLVDSSGWLRARWRPADPPGWTAPAAFAAELRTIRDQPLAAAAGGHVHH